MKEYSNLNMAGAEEALFKAAQRWFIQHGYDLDKVKNNHLFALEFKNRKDLPEGGFDISGTDTGAMISASSLSGQFAALGQFLRGCMISENGFIPPKPSGVSLPEKPVRMTYFAVHFHNFYHDAPLVKVAEYIYDLAMYGYNALLLRFDYSHYQSIDDQEALKMISRLKKLFNIAEHCGMEPGLMIIANEGYKSTPDHLKADGRYNQNGYFTRLRGWRDILVCPSVPCGTEYILNLHEQQFKIFSGIKLKYIAIWAYNYGGCTCSNCAPWGAKGYLNLINPIADQALKYFKDVKIILSTYHFDAFIHGEWEQFKNKMNKKDIQADYIIVEPGVPEMDENPEKVSAKRREIAGLPVLGFPEICMRGMRPWGGFGANPMPTYLQQLWSKHGEQMDGGLPYSEGIFDDINKFILSRLYWYGAYDVRKAVLEYAYSFFSPDLAEDICEAIYDMEETLFRKRFKLDADENLIPASKDIKGGFNVPTGPVKFIIENPDKIEKIYRNMLRIDSELSPSTAKTWRWRILLLRAMNDYGLLKNNWYVTDEILENLYELRRIYEAENAEYKLDPPIRNFVKQPL